MTQFAELGLKHFNEANKAKGAPEYFLLETIGFKQFRMRPYWWYHENFKAKPKDSSDDEARLFFLELKRIGGPNLGEPEVTNCCILEPQDLNGDDSGQNGCEAIPRILHPLSGFNVGIPPYRLTCSDPRELELNRKILAALAAAGVK